MNLKLGDGLKIPIEMAGQAVALVGIRGSGKTNTAGVIAEELLDRGQQIVVLDPTDAWWGLRSEYPVFIFGGPHGDLALNETDGKTLAEFVVQEKVPVILSLRHMRKGAQRRLVTEFCEELYHLKGRPEYREPLTVFIDEAPQFVPQRVMGEMARLVGAVQDMILLGRSAGFGVVMISQRFATLNADVRTQADTVIVHRLPSPLDRKALTEWIEENATIEEQKEVLSSLAKLKTGEAWLWAPYFELFTRAQVRPRRTFDSSAAPKRDGVARAPKDLKKVDIEKLKGKLAATIEKAKADDPRELRKQIAEKNKRISELENGTSGFARSNERAKQEVEPKRVQVLTDADRALLDKNWNRIFELSNQLNTRTSDLVAGVELKLGELVLSLQADLLKAQEQTRAAFEKRLESKGFQKILDKLASVQPPAPTPRQPKEGLRDRVAPPPATRRPVTQAHDRRPPSGPAGEDQRLIGARGFKKHVTAILSALAQHGQRSRDEILLLANYSPSGDISTAFAALLEHGWIAETGTGKLTITKAGTDALGPYEPLPTGEDLRHHTIARLSSAERKILAAAFWYYPNAASRAQLHEQAGLKPSGDTSTAFAKFLKLGWLEDRDGGIAAAATFFEG